MKKILTIVITITLLGSMLLISNSADACIDCQLTADDADYDCSEWSTNDTMVSLNKSSWPLLNKTASVNAFLVKHDCVPHCLCKEDLCSCCHDPEAEYTCACLDTQERCRCCKLERCCGIKPGILTHRGTRGIGVLSGEDDEIDSVGSYEGIIVKFDEPVSIRLVQIRSLFKEKYNGQDVIEQGDIIALDGYKLVGRYHVSGTEPIGTGNGVVNVTNIASSITEKVDRLIFFVHPFQKYAKYSDFSVAKIITEKGNISFTQPLEGIYCHSVNQYPVANDDEAKVLENSKDNKIHVLNNDFDPDNDPLTIASIDTPLHGEAKINGSVIEYTPDKDFTGVDSFRYKIVDGNGGEDDACVKIIVEDVNNPPVAEDDCVSLPEDSIDFKIDVLENDYDIDPDQQQNMLDRGFPIRHASDGDWGGAQSFVPTSDEITKLQLYMRKFGDPDFDLKVELRKDSHDGDLLDSIVISESELDSSWSWLNVDVEDVNVTPGEKYFIVIPPAPSSLTNSFGYEWGYATQDKYPNGEFFYTRDSGSSWQNLHDYDFTFRTFSDHLSIVSVSEPEHGTAFTDGEFVFYTPNSDYTGPDNFNYKITDGDGGFDTAKVHITVTPVNDAPIVGDIPDQTIEEDESFVSINLDDYVKDIEDSDCDIEWSFSGNSELSVSIVDRVATITIPDDNWNGQETITFVATDSGGLSDSDDAVFTVNSVNDAPIVGDIPDQTVDEGESFVSIVLDDFVTDDEDSDSDIVWSFSGNSELSVSIVDRVATITIPDDNWNGQETITFVATDSGGLSDSDDAVFTVNSVNDAPIVGDIPDQTILEDETFSSFDLDEFVEDEEDDDEDIHWNYTGNNELIVEIDENHVVTITVPNVNWYGSETITFVATDSGGISDSDNATFTVRFLNDAPVANDDSAEVDEDSSVLIDVLANDSDVEDGVPMLKDITVQPEHGTASIEGDMVRYTPNPDFSGTDSFTYRVNDFGGLTDTAVVTITVVNLNDAPVANDDFIELDEGETVDVLSNGDDSVLDNDSDPDGDELKAAIVCSPIHASFFQLNENGTFIYTHDGSEYTLDSFKYVAYDEHGGNDTAVVKITITSTNDAPVANDDSAEVDEDSSVLIDVLANDSDVEDGVPMLKDITVQPEHGTASIEGDMVRYTPNPDFSGTDSFTYRVNDSGSLTDTATVIIQIKNLNDAPNASKDYIEVDEGETVDVLSNGDDSVLDNDSDPDGDELKAAIVCSPIHASFFQLNENGTFIYTHDGSEYLMDSFMYSAIDDHGEVDNTTVWITILPKNDPPVAVDDEVEIIKNSENTTIHVLDNDEDPENDELTIISITENPVHGKVYINDKYVNYTPNPGYTGLDNFTYKIIDEDGLNDTAKVNIQIKEENNEEDDEEDDGDDSGGNSGGTGTTKTGGGNHYNYEPVAKINPVGPIQVLTGEVFHLDALQSEDQDGSIDNYTWDLGDENIAYGKDITYQYNKADVYMITLTVKDNLGKRDSEEVKIIVQQPNKNPSNILVKVNGELYQNEINTSENTTITFEITGTDPDGDQIKYVIDWGNGDQTTSSLIDSGDVFSVDKKWSEPGEYQIQLTAYDEKNSPSETIILDLTVNEKKINHPVADEPVEKEDPKEDEPLPEKENDEDKKTGTFPWWLIILIIAAAIIIGIIIFFWWKRKPDYIPQVIQPT